MNFGLTSEQEMIIDSVKSFVEKELFFNKTFDRVNYHFLFTCKSKIHFFRLLFNSTYLICITLPFCFGEGSFLCSLQIFCSILNTDWSISLAFALFISTWTSICSVVANKSPLSPWNIWWKMWSFTFFTKCFMGRVGIY